MMNKSKILRILSLSLTVIGFMLLSGHFTESYGQKDPFAKAPYNKTKDAPAPSSAPSNKPPKPKDEKPKPPPVGPILAPDINARINHYKNERQRAAENGLPLPKVTSVLTLDEMAITGIFRTPRGYAAMVEAKPIKLSYTIYPGEKFFDGQLVAIEENRLVFRKVTKMSNGKFIASVENKALRQYTDTEQIRGTAPVQPAAEKPAENAANTPPPPPVDAKTAAAGIVPTSVVSPLDEMNRQPQTPEKPEKLDKKGKKPVKVAKNKK